MLWYAEQSSVWQNNMHIQGVSKKSEFSENQLWQILLRLARNPCGIFDKSLLSPEVQGLHPSPDHPQPAAGQHHQGGCPD